jgi:hypothetical protein
MNPGSVPFHLPADRKRILPFQMIRSTPTGDDLTSIKAYRLDDTTNVDLTSTMLASVRVVETPNYDVIKYPATTEFGTAMADGFWYLRMTDGVQTWETEVFTIVPDLTNFMKIEFSCDGNLLYTGGHIDYTDGFEQRIYLVAKVSKPKYPIDIKSEMRQGYEFDKMVTSRKTYFVEFAAPEYLCDVLRTLRNHDNIEITANGITYPVFKLIPVIEWTNEGDYAEVELDFECDTVIHSFGRAKEFTGKDFNNDFNPDFNAET